MGDYFTYLNDLLHKKHNLYYKELVDRQPFNFDNGDTKPIAFYLPQFHSFSENDEWWGKGLFNK